MFLSVKTGISGDFREYKNTHWNCYIVTYFYLDDLDRKVVEWKLRYLSFKCSKVKVICFQKKIILKYTYSSKCTLSLSTAAEY